MEPLWQRSVSENNVFENCLWVARGLPLFCHSFLSTLPVNHTLKWLGWISFTDHILKNKDYGIELESNCKKTLLLYFLCIGKHSSGNIYQAILSLTDLQHHVCYVRCTESGPSLCSIPLVHFLFSYFKMMVHAQLLCCVWLFATLWPVARQAPLSMGFSRQKYWSGLLFPSPGENDDK